LARSGVSGTPWEGPSFNRRSTLPAAVSDRRKAENLPAARGTEKVNMPSTRPAGGPEALSGTGFLISDHGWQEARFVPSWARAGQGAGASARASRPRNQPVFGPRGVGRVSGGTSSTGAPTRGQVLPPGRRRGSGPYARRNRPRTVGVPSRFCRCRRGFVFFGPSACARGAGAKDGRDPRDG